MRACGGAADQSDARTRAAHHKRSHDNLDVCFVRGQYSVSPIEITRVILLVPLEYTRTSHSSTPQRCVHRRGTKEIVNGDYHSLLQRGIRSAGEGYDSLGNAYAVVTSACTQVRERRPSAWLCTAEKLPQSSFSNSASFAMPGLSFPQLSMRAIMICTHSCHPSGSVSRSLGSGERATAWKSKTCPKH